MTHFWKGNETQRLDAGYPDDPSRVLLAFHRQSKSLSSSCGSCADVHGSHSRIAFHPTDSGLQLAPISSFFPQITGGSVCNVNDAGKKNPLRASTDSRQPEALRKRKSSGSSRHDTDSIHSLPPVNRRDEDESSSSCPAESVISPVRTTDSSNPLSQALLTAKGANKQLTDTETTTGDKTSADIQTTVLHQSVSSSEADSLDENEDAQTVRSRQASIDVVEAVASSPSPRGFTMAQKTQDDEETISSLTQVSTDSDSFDCVPLSSTYRRKLSPISSQDENISEDTLRTRDCSFKNSMGQYMSANSSIGAAEDIIESEEMDNYDERTQSVAAIASSEENVEQEAVIITHPSHQEVDEPITPIEKADEKPLI